MNPFFIICGVALIALGLLHSVLGERLIIGPLMDMELPRIGRSRRFTARTLRFAWHITSVAWWGLAVLAFALASPGALSPGVPAAVLIGVCGVSGAIAIVASRGRHLIACIGFSVATAGAVLGLAFGG